jgi:hypothetical protein
MHVFLHVSGAQGGGGASAPSMDQYRPYYSLIYTRCKQPHEISCIFEILGDV